MEYRVITYLFTRRNVKVTSLFYVVAAFLNDISLENHFLINLHGWWWEVPGKSELSCVQRKAPRKHISSSFSVERWRVAGRTNQQRNAQSMWSNGEIASPVTTASNLWIAVSLLSDINGYERTTFNRHQSSTWSLQYRKRKHCTYFFRTLKNKEILFQNYMWI